VPQPPKKRPEVDTRAVETRAVAVEGRPSTGTSNIKGHRITSKLNFTFKAIFCQGKRVEEELLIK
jgi:hypothetical protein